MTTQSAQGNSLQPHQMFLGEVTYNNRHYIAILHYHSEDGTAKPVTAEMQRVQATYCRALQHMIDHAQRETPEQPLSRISMGGFVFAAAQDEDETSYSHTDLKTINQWHQFLFILDRPELSSQYLQDIELIEMTEEDKARLLDAVISKADEASQSRAKVVVFDAKEKIFLAAFGAHKLSRGERDAEELCKLKLHQYRSQNPDYDPSQTSK